MTLDQPQESQRADLVSGSSVAVATAADRSIVVAAEAGRFGTGPSRGGSRGGRLFRQVWFVIAVLLPSILGALYYGLVASDQYTSEFRCIVQMADPMRTAEVGGSSGAQAVSSALALNSNVVVQYIKSPQIGADVQRLVDWHQLYAKPGADPLSRLPAAASEEARAAYWANHVSAFFDLTTGTISVSVRAFTPEDARTLSSVIIKLSENLINGMTRQAHQDAVRTADEDVARAAERVQATRQRMFDFRVRDARLDPELESEADLARISKLRDSLAHTQSQLRTYQSVAHDSPIIQVLTARIDVLEAQISEAQKKLTAGSAVADGTNYTGSLRDYEAVKSQLELDEKYYDSAVASLEAARSSAERQSAYLAVFVPPNLPEAPDYPKRGEAMLLIFLSSLGFWIFSMIMYHSVREHI